MRFTSPSPPPPPSRDAACRLGETGPLHPAGPPRPGDEPSRRGWPPIELVPGPEGYVVRPPPTPRYGRAVLLFLLTFFTTTTLGVYWALAVRTDVSTDLTFLLFPSTIARVWGDPSLLAIGLRFSLPALLILLAHEMGHYLACRHYRLPATLPYFLPVPFALGTVGAFIRIRAPLRDKRQLFDVGAAGPIAGFVALIPFLLYGIAHSTPAPMPEVSAQPSPWALLYPGRSLAMELTSLLFHGPLPEGTILNLHPFALAAWFGLFATSLNLIPLGQLDGGHILYATFGRLQRRLALPLWLGLGLLGYLWPGWLLWCGIVLVMGLRHPPVRDEAEPLDRPRLWLAFATLLILVLSFIPLPLKEIYLAAGF